MSLNSAPGPESTAGSRSGPEKFRFLQNLHTHTWRCHHAKDTEKEYIEKGIRGGMKELGFSDHTPYLFPGDYYSDFRMFPELIENYADTVLRLRDEYRDDIRIYLALEVEYYPAYFDGLLSFLSRYPFDYFVLGQHFLGNEIGDVYSYGPHVGARELVRYTDQTIEAMKTGKFLFLAHPDIIRYPEEDELYTREMGRLCDAALELGMPLEVNLNGLHGRRMYPREAFWKIAGQKGNRVIFGADAHSSDTLCMPDVVAEAVRMCGRCGIRPLSRIDISRRPPEEKI